MCRPQFFILHSSLFILRSKTAAVPYNREGTETLPYRLLCFFFRADGIRPYLCLVPYALCINNRVRVSRPQLALKVRLH